MAERLLELGQGLEIWKVHIDELREQDVNARSMPKGMFDRLAQTIGRDQRLESLPLCAHRGDKGIEIISGHHRVRGSRAAGLTEIHVIMDVTGLTDDQIKAKQLAHNSIQGEDNQQLVKKIYEAIGDVERRLEAYIDPAKLNIQVEKVQIGNIDLGLEHRTALLVFLPYEKDRFDKACQAVLPFITGDLETVYMAELKLLEAWKAILRRVGKEYDIRSIGTIMAQIANIVLETLGQESDEDDCVALRDLLGTATIPAEDAAPIQDLIDRLVQEGSVTKRDRWKTLRWLIELRSMVQSGHGPLGEPENASTLG